MHVRKLTEADAAEFQQLRLRALRDDPEAFSASYEESHTVPLARVAQRLREESTTGDNCILGAFETSLVGMVGFMREPGLKEQHKGFIWGMYVQPDRRGQGIGKALLAQVIAHAEHVTGLVQVHLSVVTTQEAARHLYRSLGFEVYGLEPRALKVRGQYLDEEYMVLRLPGR
jgi:ribosomal protein S18 acetylase RimI-like enzyme